MARRSDHTREELKQLILDASWQIVRQDGFESLSARRIANEIGYTPGTIYNLFDSMDDLYLQVNAKTLTKLYMLLSSPECNDPDKTADDNIKKMASLYTGYAQSNRNHWLMLFQHTMTEETDVPEWFNQKIEAMFHPLEGLIDQFFKAKNTKKAKMAARILWSSIHGLCFLQETNKIGLVDEKTSMQGMANYLIDTFLKGLDEK